MTAKFRAIVHYRLIQAAALIIMIEVILEGGSCDAAGR